MLPEMWSHLADSGGAVTFADSDWRSVGCQARIFAHHGQGIAWEDLPPPLGFTIKGHWHWWDGTTTARRRSSKVLTPPNGWCARFLSGCFRGRG